MNATTKAAVFLALSLLYPLSSRAEVVWRGDFETGDISQWTRAQSVSADRLQVVQDPVFAGRYALKATVVAGDNPINASGNRNELVYLTYEPEGTERWYRWQTMFANDYPSAATWQLFTQFHHTGDTGSPPVEFTINGENIALGVQSQSQWRAPLVRGVWHDFVFHVKWSPDASVGFIELWYDGALVIPKKNVATQFAGQTQYLKQGLYRNNTITETGTVYHDGFVIGTTREDVWPANEPAPTPSTGTGTGSDTGSGSTPLPTADGQPAASSDGNVGAVGCSVTGNAETAAGAIFVLVGLTALVGRRRRE